MTTSVLHAGKRARSGISLLEVLISIGILSIGLLSTLALIPAGRFYMKRAAVDDRAAAVIPSAFAALNTQGMLRIDASSWRPWQGPSRAESEGEFGRELTSWIIASTTTEVISERYSPGQRTPLISTINGSVPPPSSGNTLTVNLKITTNALFTNVSPAVSQTTGAWTYILAGLAAPDMQIHESGQNIGEVSNTPYADYTFTAT